jgi:hypothetical protein
VTLFFTYNEGSILVRLLIAHCISDFLLQPNFWVLDKRLRIWQSRYLYYHVAITGFLTALLLWKLQYILPVFFITITHFLIDGLKLQAEKKYKNKKGADFRLFIADQLLHIAIIIIVWLFVINGWSRWAKMTDNITGNYTLWLRALGYILVSTPVGFIIQFLTRKWASELAVNDSLPNAGKWIGILERLLILTMVYINQFAAIGFLVAAKSILRVTDKPDKPLDDPAMTRPFSTRKHTEYVLIGTFLSVGIAIFTGLIINALLEIKI